MASFYDEIVKLKNLLRRGWVIRFGEEKVRIESDAEHIFSTQMLALKIINDNKLPLNQEKVLKMLLFHELGEIDAGDITPVDNISKAEKYNKEAQGVKRVSQVFNSQEMLNLWQEFEENKTPEAIFTRVIDKLDAIMQAKRYAKELNRQELFEEFYSTSQEVIKGYEEYLED